MVFDKNVTLITRYGRAAVSWDLTSDEFPWYPKPIGDLKSYPGDINVVTAVSPFLREVRCFCPKSHFGGNDADRRKLLRRG